MLSKEELLKNYEELKKRIPDCAKCYTIKKIVYAINNCEDYEDKINEIVSKLEYKWNRIWEKYFERIEKEACHWKREGFKSIEYYKQYLSDIIGEYGCLMSDDELNKVYAIRDTLDIISAVTREDYVLSY